MLTTLFTTFYHWWQPFMTFDQFFGTFNDFSLLAKLWKFYILSHFFTTFHTTFMPLLYHSAELASMHMPTQSFMTHTPSVMRHRCLPADDLQLKTASSLRCKRQSEAAGHRV